MPGDVCTRYNGFHAIMGGMFESSVSFRYNFSVLAYLTDQIERRYVPAIPQ